MADTVVCALLSYGAHEVFQQTGPLRALRTKADLPELQGACAWDGVPSETKQEMCEKGPAAGLKRTQQP